MLYGQRSLDATRTILGLLCGAILAAAVAGCANTPETKGFPWWPQGPGNSASDELRTANGEPAVTATHFETVASPLTQPAGNDTQAVRYGDLLFVSGQIAVDPASLSIVGSDIQAQIRAAMDNIVRILESHGMTMGNVLSVTLYLQDIGELPKADAVYASYFRRDLPARAVVRVDGLPKGSLVEISAITGK